MPRQRLATSHRILPFTRPTVTNTSFRNFVGNKPLLSHFSPKPLLAVERWSANRCVTAIKQFRHSTSLISWQAPTRSLTIPLLLGKTRLAFPYLPILTVLSLSLSAPYQGGDLPNAGLSTSTRQVRWSTSINR